MLAAGAVWLRRRNRISFEDKVVVITGARGLGLVLARQLGDVGACIVLLARDSDELDRAGADLQARGVACWTARCDVADRDDVQRAIDGAAEHFGGIDVLINNAGIIQVAPFENLRVEDFEQAMAVHLYGPLYTTLAVLPHLERRGGGRIVNISSIGGKIATPHLLPYSASKFALAGLSEGLRAELRPKNILVTTVYPGLMRTGSPPNALFRGQHQQEYAWFAIGDSLPIISTNAERAAKRIIDACRRGAPRLVITATAKAAVLVNELFPGVAAGVMAAFNRLLPDATTEQESATFTGRQSESAWTRSILTRLTERAARRNNEMPEAGIPTPG